MDEELSRREFFREGFRKLADGLKATASALYSDVETFVDEISTVRPVLIRPPGALPEKEFLEKCTRCNECVRVCPQQAVMKFVQEGSVNHLTPILNMRKAACVLCVDFPCAQVCAPQALEMPLSPRHVKMGVAVVHTKLCYAWAGSDCDYCVKECPFPGEAIFLDESRRPVVNQNICVGCGLCEKACPARQPAITVKLAVV